MGFMLRKSVFVALLACSLSLFGNASYLQAIFEPQMLDAVRARYGADALSRVQQWHDLLQDGQTESDWVRLNKVNQFFNEQMAYKTDLEHWKQTDYWATPVESLAQQPVTVKILR